jgi:hypothetical protein
MNIRYYINWSIWIGVWSGIYVILYLLSPLASYGMLPATFVGLPIFFLAGAKKEEFLNFSVSAIVGVLWALLYLYLINVLNEMGVPGFLSQGLIVGAVTIVLCAIHFPLPFCNKIPMMFGAIAFTFITGATAPIAVMITFVLGITLAYICNQGTLFLTEDGKWKLPNNQ